MSSDFSPAFLRLAEDIFTCRDCRTLSPTFAEEVKDPNRHPEMAHGPTSPTILIISINPKFDPHRVLTPDVASFVRHATSPSSVNEMNPFDRALAKALPPGYGLKEGNVTNTRVYKCATTTETRVKGVAARCADRFLRREIDIMRPRVVLAMGKTAWPEVFRVLDAGPVPQGQGPHAALGRSDEHAIPIVACWHLTGNVSARADTYRFAVRQLISNALQRVS